MKIAEYRHAVHGHSIVLDCVDHTGEMKDTAGDGLVRFSEPMEVTFTPLPPSQISGVQVQKLDEEIRKITEEFAKRIDVLKSRRQELLALTHEVQP